MEIQSNSIAASLFEGLAQSQQTQGTTAKDDMFAKMMDRALADAATRKREQADDDARDAKDARDARAAEAQRKAPVRAEPRRDTAAAQAAQAARSAADARADAKADTAKETQAAEPPAPKTATKPDNDKSDRTVHAKRDDRKTAKTDKPAAKDAAKTDGADSTADADKPQATDEAAADPEAMTATAGTDADPDSGADTADSAAEALASADAAAQAASQQPPLPQASDLILAGLQSPGRTAVKGADGQGTEGDTPAGTTGATDAATQLAQAKAAAEGALAGAKAKATAADAAAAATDAKATDAKAADAKTADAGQTVAQAAADQPGEALPSDDDATLPNNFADLLAAAKAKTGEAKPGAKPQASTDGGSRNDAQPQGMAQPAPQVAAAIAPAITPATGTVAAADSKAVGALEGTDSAAAAGSAGATTGTSPHAHPALAAMEGQQIGAPTIDPTQATATLRPSRGSAGMPMGVQDQIAVHIKKNADADVDQFTINLHPAELGRIDIKLDIGADGRVNAMVAVEKAQTLELLQRDSRGLERALQDAGLQTDSNSLSFSLRGEGNPFANDGRGDGKGGGSGRRGRGFGGSGDDDGSDTATYTATLGNGRLDIKA